MHNKLVFSIAGLSFKKSTSKKGFEGVLEAGQRLQAGALGARPVVSISSSLPFTPINLVFKVGNINTTCMLSSWTTSELPHVLKVMLL